VAPQAVARPQPPARPTPPPPADDGPPAWLDADDDLQAVAPPARGASPVPIPSSTPKPPAVTLVPTALGDRWFEIVCAMAEAGQISAMARELAMQAQCLSIEGEVWKLRVERETLRAQPLMDKLQAALAAHLGHAVRLEAEPGVATDSTSQRLTAERNRRQAEAEQIINDDPFVQAVMQQFKTARIVPGSVKPH
jgi:DNA polymerase-3 subunit gamma/tau